MKLILTLLLTLGLTLHADDAAVAAKLAKIPKPAAEALKKAAGTGHIESVSLEKDGKVTVYEAVITEKGKPEREVSSNAEGKIVLDEFTMPLADVPAVVKKAIEAGAKGATIKRVQHISREGKVTFEALYVLKGKESEVEYLEDGSVKPD
jgi:hypothetical protein